MSKSGQSAKSIVSPAGQPSLVNFALQSNQLGDSARPPINPPSSLLMGPKGSGRLCTNAINLLVSRTLLAAIPCSLHNITFTRLETSCPFLLPNNN